MKRFFVILAGFTLAMAALFYQEVKQAVIVAAYALAGLLLIVTLALGWYLAEKVRYYRAKRQEAEKQAQVMVINAHNGVWVRDTNPNAYYHALHLDQRVYSNGRFNDPSPLEAQAWQLVNTPRRAAAAPPPALLPPPAPVDLLAALDAVQRCLIVGATDTGKTTLLQHIITRRLQVSKVVVIDPHAYPDKWPGCMVIGASRNYSQIDRALSALVQLMSKRYSGIGRGLVAEGHHPRLTILIDEWRAIVANVKSASEAIKALLTESRKAAFSVFVATHSDRAKPLGLEGEYDLKDGFAVVRLSIANGQRQAAIDTGNGELPATLPGPFIARRPAMESDDFINLEVEPTPTEAAILHLYEQGESFNEIARQVFGNTGGKQTEKIKQIITRFN